MRHTLLRTRNEELEGPKNKDYLLKPNELLNLFKDFKIVITKNLF